MNRGERPRRRPTIWDRFRAITFIAALVVNVVGLLSTDFALLEDRLGLIGELLAELPSSGVIQSARIRFTSELGPLYLVLAFLLSIVTYYEWKEQRIPNMITYPGILIGIGLTGLLTLEAPLGSLSGMAIGLAIVLPVTMMDPEEVYDVIGGGAIKTAAMIGAFLGFVLIIWVLVVSTWLFMAGLLAYAAWRTASHRPLEGHPLRGGERIEWGPVFTSGTLIVILLPLNIDPWVTTAAAVSTVLAFALYWLLLPQVLKRVRHS